MTETAASHIAVAFLVMTLLGYFLTELVCPGEIPTKFALALAPVIGMGLCSILFLVFRNPMFTVEFSLLAVSIAVWLLRRKRTSAKEAWTEWRTPILATTMVGVLAWVTFASFIWIGRGPHGDWDGWAIWNSKARYLYLAGAVWQDHMKDTNQSDYPLLLPASTARLWRYIGTDIPEAGGVQLLLIAISGVVILAAGLWELRAGSGSFLVPLLLLGTPFYLILVVWQYAEIPLTVYILSTIALICFYWAREPHRARILLLAGFTAGCAAWTKNEGLLFVLVTSFALLIPIIRQPIKTVRRVAMFALGLMPPLAVTLYFKYTLATPNGIMADRTSADLVAKILDSSRYSTIASAFLNTAWSFGNWAIHPGIPLIVLMAAWGINGRAIRNGGWITGAGILTMMLSGYFAIYLITPYPLSYHIPTSLNRLLMHLWPSLLFLAGLAVKTSNPTNSLSKSQ